MYKEAVVISSWSPDLVPSFVIPEALPCLTAKIVNKWKQRAQIAATAWSIQVRAVEDEE
jgi:hypothetical protein